MKRYAIAILTSLLIPAVAIACPMCKDSIPNSDAQAAVGLPGGFNTSVYLMLVGFFACLEIHVVRDHKGRDEHELTDGPA